MDGLGIELPWMLTVVGVMCAYGLVALIGTLMSKNSSKQSNN
jgi:hypothetical protein